MAPVKFSMTMATVSAQALGGCSQSHTKARLEIICRMAPSHSAVTSGSARGHGAAGKAADQQGGKPQRP